MKIDGDECSNAPCAQQKSNIRFAFERTNARPVHHSDWRSSLSIQLSFGKGGGELTGLPKEVRTPVWRALVRLRPVFSTFKAERRNAFSVAFTREVSVLPLTCWRYADGFSSSWGQSTPVNIIHVQE